MWYMAADGLWNTEFAELPVNKSMEQPYPKSLWIMQNGKLTTELFDTSITYGAFANTTELSTIRIPESVKKIGVESFAHTQLTSVTIARDCKYYETSFPVGCDINFYD